MTCPEPSFWEVENRDWPAGILRTKRPLCPLLGFSVHLRSAWGWRSAGGERTFTSPLTICSGKDQARRRGNPCTRFHTCPAAMWNELDRLTPFPFKRLPREISGTQGALQNLSSPPLQTPGSPPHPRPQESSQWFFDLQCLKPTKWFSLSVPPPTVDCGFCFPLPPPRHYTNTSILRRGGGLEFAAQPDQSRLCQCYFLAVLVTELNVSMFCQDGLLSVGGERQGLGVIIGQFPPCRRF